MDFVDLTDWLIRNAGPVIKYRTVVDLCDEQNVGIVEVLLKNLFASPLVKYWLSRLKSTIDLKQLHSSNPDAYENVMGKLVQLGMRAGLQPFDNKTLPFRIWLSDYNNYSAPLSVFYQTIVASFLSYAGYGNITPVFSHLKKRLAALYSFARDPDFDSIYIDKTKVKGFPKGRHYDSHRLVNPELYPNKQFMLPWVHDIRGIASCREIMDDSLWREKAESVIEMILTQDYQNIPFSYGIADYGGKYYVIGWAVNLPGYYTKPTERNFAWLLRTMEYMARFEAGRKSSWFQKSLEYLEDFQTNDGIYFFPHAWLPEKNMGYWVHGAYMGLEENRRTKKTIEIESTFWILWIRHLAGSVNP
ncbi:MAG: hypothetical protein ACFE8L_02445 [Candidatus Hodarchaeota archaeon]